MRKIRAAFVLGVFAIGVGQSAHAADGVLEINQACAVNTGCFPGDNPGFPVTINSPGSYRLTSNLQAPAGPDAIDASQTVSARIDLGNFRIDGAIGTSGDGIALSRDSTVSNGAVFGFARGVFGGSRIHAVRAIGNGQGFVFNRAETVVTESAAESSGGSGFQGPATYRDCVASDNGGDGFNAFEGSVLVRVRALRNTGAGIRIRGNGVVRDSASYENTGEGIHAVSAFRPSQFGPVIESNVVSENTTDGILVGPGSLVARNVVRANGAAGISALSSSSVQGNVATANGVYGLYLVPENGGTAAAYRDNFVTGSPNSVAGGINMGGNSCNGTTTCP